MSTISCPKCGNPLRPGARFCGNCGTVLPATPTPAAPRPAPPPVQSTAQPTPGKENLCPHCGKPVRPGAKFCNNCGKAIGSGPLPAAPGAAQPAPVPPAPSGTPVTPGPSSRPVPAAQQAARKPPTGPIVAGQAGPSSRPVAAAQKPAATSTGTKKRPIWPIFLIILLLVACLGVVVGGYFFYLKDTLMLLGPKQSPGATTTVKTPVGAPTTAVKPSNTAAATPGPTNTLQPTAAPATQTAQPSLTSAPPTVTLTPVITPTTALTSLKFEDNFNGPLNKTTWKAWGDPLPKTKSGPIPWLYLTAEIPSDAGVSLRDPLLFTPGTLIQFDARLDPAYTQFTLIFDWDPPNLVRDQGVKEPGVIHIEIRKDSITFDTPITLDGCEKQAPDFDGTLPHSYQVRKLEKLGVALFIDNAPVPICAVQDMGLTLDSGRISFSGLGWITLVRVLGP